MILLTKYLVHPGDVVRLEEIVRIKNEISVKVVIAPGVPDLLDEVVEGVAFSHLLLVETLINNSAGIPGHPGSGIRTVVGHHKRHDQIGWVILLADTVEKLGDNRFLIPGGDKDGIAPQGSLHLFFLLGCQGHRDV